MFGAQIFGGMRPRMESHLLEEGQATVARNCWNTSGALTPMPPLDDQSITVNALTRTIYRYQSNQWFTWSADVDVAPAPVIEDTVRRTCWTGDGAPKLTTTVILGAFSSPGKPAGTRNLGIPAPESAPEVAATEVADPTEIRVLSDIPGSPEDGDYLYFAADVEELAGFVDTDGTSAVTMATAGDWFVRDGSNWKKTDEPDDFLDPGVPEEYHSWVYTYVSDLGEEGPPSRASAIVKRGFDTAGGIQPVTITTDSGPSGAYVINAKRIYRTITGSTGVTSYNFLVEIPVATTTYEDTAQGSVLGEELPSEDWMPPPETLKGLISLPNGVLAGFDGRDVYFSEPFQAHAWPRAFVQNVSHDIVGLGVFGTTVVVCTTGPPYIISGTDPASYAAAQGELEQACVSKRSIATIDKQGVVYASPDGLVLVGPGGARIITDAAYDLKTWRALGPEGLIGAYHDRRYVGFLAESAIAFDPDRKEVYEFDDDVAAVFNDRERDELYVVSTVGGTTKIFEWRTTLDPADSPRTAVWRSKTFRAPLHSPTALQVIGGPASAIKLHADGAETALTQVQLPTDNQPVRVPAIGLARDWSVELETDEKITDVRVGEMEDML